MNPHPASIGEAEFIRDPQAREKQPKLLFVLRAYCLGLLKACCFVNELVKDELYYEVRLMGRNNYHFNKLLRIYRKKTLSLTRTIVIYSLIYRLAPSIIYYSRPGVTFVPLAMKLRRISPQPWTFGLSYVSHS